MRGSINKLASVRQCHKASFKWMGKLIHQGTVLESFEVVQIKLAARQGRGLGSDAVNSKRTGRTSLT